MTDLSVTERRLRPIIDAVASRNWKQALQQCDKWQKKGEKSDRFLALKASILINQPDKSQYEKGKTETLQLCHRDPVVTDIEALYQLQDSLKHLSLHKKEGPKLWERAIAARPNDKDLLITLLYGSVNDGNWTSAQKAAMALRKAFPKERQYDFWNMFMCYLIYQDDGTEAKDRELFGKLAYMLMTKAAAATSAEKGQVLTAGKAVATPEELGLLTKIYIATGHANEAVKLLQDKDVGLESSIADLDPQFVFSLLLDALDASDGADEVLSTCKKLISVDSPHFRQRLDDDRLWSLIERSCRGSRFSVAEACRELAQASYQSEPKCRAAYLTFFNLAADKSFLSTAEGTDSLARSCIRYFQTFARKPFCFSDLVQPLQLSEQAYDKFMLEIHPSGGDELQLAFDLKMRHARMGIEGSDAPDAEYLKLATDAVRLHKRLSKDKTECPEMILLAATSLLRLAWMTHKTVYALQASFMLQNCHSRFSEYYPVAIRQIQLHSIQGQMSLAIAKFTKLAVKNLQWETVGHLLLTRISSLHPWATGNTTSSVSPLASLDAGLTMLDNADRHLSEAVREGLKRSYYANIIDTIDVRSKMTRSMNRQILTVEERRIQRVVGVPLDIPLDPYPAKMVDQRDFSFLPDFSKFEGRHQFEESLRCGPIPKQMWLTAMALHDHVTTYLKAELTSQTTLASVTFERLRYVLEQSKLPDNEWKSELTEEEMSGFACDKTLAEALLLAKDLPVSEQPDFDLCIDGVKTWLDLTISSPAVGTSFCNGVETPTWKFLHNSFINLEVVQTISLFLSLQARRTKSSKAGKAIVVPKDQLSELQHMVVEAEKAIHVHTKKLKDGINVSGVLSKLVDAAAGRIEEGELVSIKEYRGLADELGDLIDEVALEEFCGKLKESWEDALDGILKVKIKTLK